MRRWTVGVAAGWGLAMLAVSSCTTPPAPPLSPAAAPSPAKPWTPRPSASSPPPAPSSSPSLSPSPSPEPPSTSGPATSVGDGKVTAADGPLLAAVRRVPDLQVPDDDSVIVIHREGPDAGELAWMPDDRHYCLAEIRYEGVTTSCNPLPASWARIGIRLVTKGRPYPDQPGRSDTRTVFFAVVDGGHGPYHYTATGEPGPGMGPIRDATAVFASGRTLSLLTYERPTVGLSPSDREICSADNAICFPALDVYVSQDRTTPPKAPAR